jgi:5-oxopent-3-ene-1,2,5-tricarboxylate decarboxylase / 2-hydroxyhepta-2,4-diene-1,7-dioate isomerase
VKIGYFRYDNKSFIGAVSAGQVLDLTGAFWRGDHPFLQDLTTLVRSENFRPRLMDFLFEEAGDRSDLRHRLEDLTFLPLYRPGKIICLGLNYVGHANETGWTPPEEPIYFEKATSAMVAHGQPIVCPPGIGRVDPEGELAVIIGKGARGVAAAEAADYVAGYTILNDVTARDIQGRDHEKKMPWYRSKSVDTFCPVGPWIVTSDEIDPEEPLSIQLRVNGEVRQDSSTGNLIFSIPTLIERISQLIALDAGDIISTGTPEGIAPIHPGDIVEIEVEKIGVLTNPVVAGSH